MASTSHEKVKLTSMNYDKVKKKREMKAVYKRRSNRKSRSGCGTCKIRKVKCDETKPTCNRCKIAMVKCDGYMNPAQTPKPPSKQPLIRSPTTSLLFENPTEAIYFSYFRDVVSSELSGSLDMGFWSRLVLQSSYTEPFILKAVIAISALYSSQNPLRSQSHLLSLTDHSNTTFALESYQKAVQMMIKSLTHTPSPRSALLMCLLICCFEGLSGNTYAALSHARSGQKLLEEWLSTHPYSNPAFEGIISPANHEVEDDLLLAASFFEQQISGIFDNRENFVFARRKRLSDEAVRNMPIRFEKLRDASVYWLIVNRRVMNFMMDTIRNIQMFRGDCRKYGNSIEGASPPPIEEKMRAYYQECHQYSHEVACWKTAFQPLYSQLQHQISADNHLIAAAHTLYLQARMQDLILLGMGEHLHSPKHSAASTNLEPEADTEEEHLQWVELLSLSRTVINCYKTKSTNSNQDLDPNSSSIPQSQTKYRFEFGIVPTLHFVAKYCVDTQLRTEAIELMRVYDTREGNWDSAILADVDEAFLGLDLEENGKDGERGVKIIEEMRRANNDKDGRGEEKMASIIGGLKALRVEEEEEGALVVGEMMRRWRLRWDRETQIRMK